MTTLFVVYMKFSAVVHDQTSVVGDPGIKPIGGSLEKKEISYFTRKSIIEYNNVIISRPVGN